MVGHAWGRIAHLMLLFTFHVLNNDVIWNETIKLPANTITDLCDTLPSRTLNQYETKQGENFQQCWCRILPVVNTPPTTPTWKIFMADHCFEYDVTMYFSDQITEWDKKASTLGDILPLGYPPTRYPTPWYSPLDTPTPDTLPLGTLTLRIP